MLCSFPSCRHRTFIAKKIAIKSVFFQNEATSLLILSLIRQHFQCINDTETNVPTFPSSVTMCMCVARTFDALNILVTVYFVCVSWHIECSVCLHVSSNICENIHAYFLLYNKFKLILRSATLKHLPS